MPEYKKDEAELGVLWEKSGAKGTWFSGSIEIDNQKIPVVVFRNGNKKSDKAPDFRILRAQRRADAAAPTTDTFDESPF